jgi:tRNA(Ile)-lysidine synthase
VPDLLQRVRDTGLLPQSQAVVVLLSGGRDSVCLLDVAVELAGRGSVSALHVNYGLRDEADGDQAHCAALCDRLGVALDVERAQRPQEGGGNLQAWARDVRYAAGATRAAARRAGLAAAHTSTDQAETILYRLAASPGRRALLGMEARSGLLVRPLLGVTREDTAAWCLSRGLSWRDDATNEDATYARARIRSGLLPALRDVHPEAERNVLRTAELLRDEAAVLDEVVATALAGRDRIGIAHLGELPVPVARLVVRRLAEGATGALCPRAASRLDDVLALAACARPTASLDLGDGARAVVDDGVLRMTRTPRQAGG